MARSTALWSVQALCVSVCVGVFSLLAVCISLGVLFVAATVLFTPRVATFEEVLHLDYTQPRPYANASIGRGGAQDGWRREFKAGEHLRIWLELQVPEKTENFSVFQVLAVLTAADNTTLDETSRPAMLQYRSGITHVLRTVAKQPLMALGGASESQRLLVPLFEDYVEQSRQGLATVHVALAPPLVGVPVQIASARLRVEVLMSALRRLLYWVRPWWSGAVLLLGVAGWCGASGAAAVCVAVGVWSLTPSAEALWDERQVSRADLPLADARDVASSVQAVPLAAVPTSDSGGSTAFSSCSDS